MNFRKSLALSSLVAAALLFSACGGDDTKKPPVVVASTGVVPVFVSPTAYNVVAGERKAITLTVGENIINAEGSKFRFELVDKTAAPSTTINADTGVIKYNAPADGSSRSITVKAVRILEGTTESAPYTITFNSQAKDAVVVKPYKTGAEEDAGTGNIEREFKSDSTVNYNIEDPSGLQWADTASEFAKDTQLTYSAARDYCENEVVGDWRVPNKDELMNLIDYSKAGRAPMVSELFKVELVNTWATPEFEKNIYVGENNGMIFYSNESVLAVRCVLGDEADREHLIHSDLLNYTYDESTKLEWSPASNDIMTATEGNAYCSQLSSSHDVPHTNFRLPSINEFRSVVENGTVSDFITKGNRQLISSTPYVDENGTTATDVTWRLVLREDGTVAIGAGVDANRISCVKDM